MQAGINVFVTNNNPWSFADYYDGIPIEFPSGKRVSVELEAAAHFFGFPVDEDGRVTAVEPDKSYIFRRYGWNTPSFRIEPSPEGRIVLNPAKAMQNAETAFKNLVIETVEYQLVEKNRRDDRLPAPRKGAGRTERVPAVLSPEEEQRQREIQAKRMAALAKARAARKAKKDAEATEPVAEPAGEVAA